MSHHKKDKHLRSKAGKRPVGPARPGQKLVPPAEPNLDKPADQAQDPKRRLGQYGGKGEHPRTGGGHH